jgi:hypothetical protein
VPAGAERCPSCGEVLAREGGETTGATPCPSCGESSAEVLSRVRGRGGALTPNEVRCRGCGTTYYARRGWLGVGPGAGLVIVGVLLVVLFVGAAVLLG